MKKSSYALRLLVWVVAVAIASLLGGVVLMNLAENLHEMGFLHRALGYWESAGVTFSFTVLYYIISTPSRIDD